MKNNHRRSGGAISVPAGVAIGTIICVCAAILSALGFAYLIHSGKMDIHAIGTGAMVILFVSAAFGCWIASALVRQKKLLVSSLTAIAYCLVLLSITAVFFDGIYGGGIAAIGMVLLGAGGSLLPGMLKKPGKSKIKIPAYR